MNVKTFQKKSALVLHCSLLVWYYRRVGMCVSVCEKGRERVNTCLILPREGEGQRQRNRGE